MIPSLKIRIHWAWVIFLVSFVTIFTTYTIRLSYGVLMPAMIGTLKISKVQAGAIASSFFIAYAVFSPLLGFWVDRFNARKLIVLFCCILGIGAFLMGTSRSLFQACLFYGLVGVGSSAMWIPVVTVVQRWFGEMRRGRILGILSSSFALGYGILGLTLPALVGRYGWPVCWFIFSGCAFALAPLNWAFLRANPRDLNLRPWGEERLLPSSSLSPGDPRKVRYKDLLLLSNVWWIGIAYFLTSLTAYLMITFLVTYGTMELKFPYDQAAKLASAIAFSGLLGSFLIPALSDFLGRKKCLILVNAFLAFSILGIVFAGNHWVVLLSAASLFGFFYAAAWPMYAAAAADFSFREATGRVLGFWTLFYGFGAILAPVLGGYIADQTGTFIWSFLTAAGSGLAAALCFLPVKKKSPRPQNIGL